MKTIHRFSLVLGLLLGFLAATALYHVPSLHAQEARKDALTQEEIDKRLDDILLAQKAIMDRIDTIVTQTQFLKSSSGK